MQKSGEEPGYEASSQYHVPSVFFTWKGQMAAMH